MKIYTEEQVRKAIKMGISIAHYNYLEIDSNIDYFSKAVEKLTPIELPSNEEIEKLGGSGMEDAYNAGLKHGAKWMKEQILKQNK